MFVLQDSHTAAHARVAPHAVRVPAIILVEDEPDVLIILHRLMRDLTGGYDIIPVQSGAQALAQLALRPVPLLITDYNMLAMSGVELARAVKDVAPETMVVLITAYGTPELERRGRAAGVDQYLAKPFPLDRLEQIVSMALTNWQSPVA
jgi:two-component system, response regulator, stage 0 sporulation protein F